MNTEQDPNFIRVLVDSIEPNPWQPRREFDVKALDSLAASLLQDGVLQPLVVSPHPFIENKYFVIAGERRLRAAKIAGLKTVPVSLKKLNLETDDQLRVALVENIQRSDLNVIEEGKAYRSLIDRFGYSQEECAKKLGKDRITVTNALRILNLPEEIHQDLINGRITAGHARALASLTDKTRILLARSSILKRELNVRETERLCKKLKSEETNKPLHETDSDLRYIEESLQSILGTLVSIRGSTKRGRIELNYYSQESLEKLLAILGFSSTAN
jgi:ParB family chromosome partitioning protein